jgi:transglutaminase-like putative cysteine protease
VRKKAALLLVTLMLFANPVISLAQSAKTSSSVDLNFISSGIVKVKASNLEQKRLKLMVEKEGMAYYYDLKGDGNPESFPLQMGNGRYSISILENLEGDEYYFVSTREATLDLKDDKKVFLNSIQSINWSRSALTAEKAGELVKDAGSEEEKVRNIYDFIISNIKYDFKKLDKLPEGYIPDADSVLKDGKGICYDFSSLFAAMLRSAGIPAKLVKGYAGDVKGYHAWNEVYLESAGGWVAIDTTYDSQMKASGVKIDMIKNGEGYTKVREY